MRAISRWHYNSFWLRNKQRFEYFARQVRRTRDGIVDKVDRIVPSNAGVHIGFGAQALTFTFGISIDVIANRYTNEVSVFGSPAIGGALGKTGFLDVGLLLGAKMKSNDAYNGLFVNSGAQIPLGKYGSGNFTRFYAPPDDGNSPEGTVNSYLPPVGGNSALAVYKNYSYSVELLTFRNNVLTGPKWPTQQSVMQAVDFALQDAVQSLLGVFHAK